ncbi:NADH dehydrogenase Fe-S protein subunit 6 ndufs6 [Chamberlinius hualienensis]
MAAVSRAVSTARRLHKYNLLAPTISCLRSNSTAQEVTVEDKPIHTGQSWTADDYRLARFIDRPKQVNDRYAINLVNEIPPKAVKGNSVCCNGGGGPLGHPKVYINLDKAGNHACGYCGLRFYQDAEHHH